MKTIFISIANYRDPEIRSTILSAIENAEYPERVHFGVFSQVKPEEYIDLSDISNLVEVVVPESEAQGAGYARSKTQELYSNQDYFLQIDAHSIFVKHWDSKTENIYRKIQEETDNEKIIISFYAKPYYRRASGSIVYEHVDNSWSVNVPHYVQLQEFNRGWIGIRKEIPDGEDYHESSCVLGGFIFATGKIVEEIPYDKDICWTGEEMLFSLRAYTRGWKIYSPRELLLWHNYERHGNPRIWDSEKKWNLLESLAKIKMYEIILTEKDFGLYGVGNKNLYKEYIYKFNKDIRNRAQWFLTRELGRLNNEVGYR